MKSILISFFLLVLSTVQPANAAEGVGGVHHLGLTVTDLEASQQFFTEVLGFSTVGGDESYPSVFVSNGEIMVSLWRANDPASATPFNRKTNVGLHHLAFQMESRETLDTLYQQLQAAPGVEIEFSPEPLTGTPATHMMIREPSGNRLEFIYWPG
jgi:lactoylglutathione lyase